MHTTCTAFVFALVLACHATAPPPSGLHESLVAAARAGDTKTVRNLLARGADPNEADAEDNRWPPLMHAVHKHQLAAAVALLDGGADPNRAAARGFSPLLMATGYGHNDTMLLLIARGANANARDAHGANAIDVALEGLPDLDRLTFFDCQDSTVRALVAAAPKHDPPSRIARIWAHAKGCDGAVSVATERHGA
jgi:hypothetical protein